MIELSNEHLQVRFHEDRPFPATYLHKPTGLEFAGPERDGRLSINGLPLPWNELRIEAESGGLPHRVVYCVFDDRRDIHIRFACELVGFVLNVEVAVVSDPHAALRTLEWDEQPVLACPGADARLWREEWSQKSWDADIGRGLWTPQLADRALEQAAPDAEPRPGVYACWYRPGKLCAAVLSNGRYMPIRTQTAGGEPAVRLGLGPYPFRVRKRCAEPLRFRVAFLGDLNGDGQIDASDFQLWVNRQLPQPPPRYRDAVWYKIYCGDPGRGVMTTLAEAEEIVRRIHGATGGLPQIVHLVGWQYDGHDTGYPSIDRFDTQLGTRDELWRLHERCKRELNTVLSYHINLDDSYQEHPGWDESVIGREPGGGLMRWERFNDRMSYHITHTKDVESGKVFAKIEAMMREVPLEGAIHIDAFRNMNWSWEPDGFIGAVEELECGVKPIVEHFRSRGIEVTTESIDSSGAEWTGIVSGVLHAGAPRELIQLRHGKLLIGGRGWPPSLWNWGLGSSINWDVIAREGDRGFDERGAWTALLDGVYLGSLLYHYYLEREMTAFHADAEGARIRFGDGTEVAVKRDSSRLLATCGDVVVADDYDRFIPRGAAIYAYSRDGSKRGWHLPNRFQDRTLLVEPLTGKEPSRKVQVAGSIHLDLAPRVPVRISIVD